MKIREFARNFVVIIISVNIRIQQTSNFKNRTIFSFSKKFANGPKNWQIFAIQSSLDLYFYAEPESAKNACKFLEIKMYYLRLFYIPTCVLTHVQGTSQTKNFKSPSFSFDFLWIVKFTTVIIVERRHRCWRLYIIISN